MIPEIEFRYSGVYDRQYRNDPRVKKYFEESEYDYPSIEEIKKRIKSLQDSWDNIKSDVLKEISGIYNLDWQEKKIICYITGVGRPISDPLTIGLWKDSWRDNAGLIDNLVHELLHQIQSQNISKITSWFREYLMEKYVNETRTTRSHILLHAVHKQIYEKFFDITRLQKDIEKCKKHPDYNRAWEIVEKEGAKNIIKKFHEVIGK